MYWNMIFIKFTIDFLYFYITKLCALCRKILASPLFYTYPPTHTSMSTTHPPTHTHSTRLYHLKGLMYEFISHVLEKWIVVGFQRTKGLRNMRMGLNVSTHLQYKIQQAKYQLDALANNVGIWIPHSSNC